MEYNVSLDIKAFCKYKNISLDEFSLLVGIDLSTLSKVINKKISLTDEVLEKIYEYFYLNGFDINVL